MFKIFGVAQIPNIDLRNVPTAAASQARIDAILGVVFGVLGTVAVLMIVIGGVKYIASKGNPGDMSKAKDTILYSVIGLAIVIMAYGIVSFVIRNV